MWKKLELWGAFVTAAYLAVIGWWVSKKWSSFLGLELNALGDFLAGAFGPIAFLWLVLGFLQQGRELRLQVAELSLSVQQQTVMAEAAIEQIKSQKAALDIQIWQHEKSISPSFDVQVFVVSGPTPMGRTTSVIRITNRAATVDGIEVLLDRPLGDGEPLEVGQLSSLGVSDDIKFDYASIAEDAIGFLKINYVRSDGAARSADFVYEALKNGKVSVIKVPPATVPGTRPHGVSYAL
ncbi:Hypothetical protein, putative membrane protein [Pseudomonas brassicacearum subsp. brassicacearum NFM421]|uniref:Uncharacterized protein n=1 Tax=Pseudomonas brassicacearum (strain NFM421) TaxID=994484 RepID=F2KJK2_PSEBN|nr:hypothetical protein [Pseudomonas brassicacearum]AEA70228.1 Hypothetical protein, putative membrane protein [Pseudomonas brassicacearum subsp. brassicacearum NFM421]